MRWCVCWVAVAPMLFSACAVATSFACALRPSQTTRMMNHPQRSTRDDDRQNPPWRRAGDSTSCRSRVSGLDVADGVVAFALAGQQASVRMMLMSYFVCVSSFSALCCSSRHERAHRGVHRARLPDAAPPVGSVRRVHHGQAAGGTGAGQQRGVRVEPGQAAQRCAAHDLRSARSSLFLLSLFSAVVLLFRTWS